MEQPSEPSTSGAKIPQSEKIDFHYCPFCGGKAEDAKTNQKETCPYEGCGKTFLIRNY